MTRVSTTTDRYTCDRCGATVTEEAGTSVCKVDKWGNLTAQDNTGAAILGGYKFDLCALCVEKLKHWWAHP
jgi:hypothetical protein